MPLSDSAVIKKVVSSSITSVCVVSGTSGTLGSRNVAGGLKNRSEPGNNSATQYSIVEYKWNLDKAFSGPVERVCVEMD